MNKFTRHIFAAASGAVVFIIYLMTLHPSVGFIDCGELAAACYTFGVPHPTGYPLFLIIGFLFSHLPVGESVIYRLNLLSAIESTIAVIITYYVIVILLQNLVPLFLKHKKIYPDKKGSQAAFDPENINLFIIACFTAISAGLVKSFWFEATQVEVYALHSLFISLIFLLTLNILFNLNALSKKYWALLFLILSLSLANHSTTIYFIPGLIYLFYLQYKVNKAFAKSILVYLLLILPGILLYLMLIPIASSQPYLNWSNPHNFDNLIHHMRGSDFSQLMFASSSNFSKNAEFFFKNIVGEMAILPGLAGLTGLVMIWKVNRHLFYFVLLLIATSLLYSFNYSTIEIQSFYLIVYYLLACFASAGIVFLLVNFGEKKFLFLSKVIPSVVFAGVVIIAFNIGYNFKENNNSANYVNEDITKNILNVLDKNSILLTYDYAFVYSSSLYYQQVEKLRPDVKVFNVKFLSAVWFLETLKKHYPDVYEVFKPEAEEYIKTYNIEDKNHSSRLMSLVKGFFEKSIKWFPVYLTVDCLISKEMAAFISAYSAEPDGLVYRLKEKNAAYNPDAGKLSLDAVFRKYEPLGFHKNKMFVSTPGVYYETAFYHYKNKNFQASMKFIDKALALNSGFRDALTLKNQINNESK